MPTLRQHLRDFRRDTGGAIAILFAFSAVPVFGLLGGPSTTFGQPAIPATPAIFDAAAMAAAAAGPFGEGLRWNCDRHQPLAGPLDSRLSSYPISISATADGTTIEIKTKRRTMQTSFLGIVGINSLNVVARTKGDLDLYRDDHRNNP